MLCITEITFPILVVLYLGFLISVSCYFVSLSRSSVFQRMLHLFGEYQALHYYNLFCDDELHRPAFLQLLKTFLKMLAEFIHFWGAESKPELNFSLSRTMPSKPALSIISGMCTPG
jgi:hypothetical protein